MKLTILVIATIVSLASMSGGWKTQSVTDPDVIKLAHKATNTFNQQSNAAVYHGLIDVVSAKSQVVAGSLYEIQLKVGETDVKKNEVAHENVKHETLKATPNGKQQLVTVKIWSKPWEDFEEITIEGVKSV
uniref:Cystatin domain-containing protein n=1 Tax=Rhabditophanes sp. KR3021 TaxID=114890 RepID=A0AC35UG46_9BILA